MPTNLFTKPILLTMVAHGSVAENSLGSVKKVLVAQNWAIAISKKSNANPEADIH
jgi:hypothetical protein